MDNSDAWTSVTRGVNGLPGATGKGSQTGTGKTTFRLPEVSPVKRNGSQSTFTLRRDCGTRFAKDEVGFLRGEPGTPAYLVRSKLMRAGDMEPNPGPAKYPCGKCSRNTENSWAIQCDWCGIWFHEKCAGLQKGPLKKHRRETAWRCDDCKMLTAPRDFFPCGICRNHVGYTG